MSQKITTNSYPGTRDFYPKEMSFRSKMFTMIETAVSSFAYEKISGPLLESFEIFAAKSGEEIAEQQLYVFTDKGDRRVAIRPELTPTIARMFSAKMNEIAGIQRWFSIENFMRYERPQKGRLREFYQVNVDLIGAKGSFADFEILSVAQNVFEIFGATQEMYEIRVNHRILIRDALVQYIGIEENQVDAVAKIMDKKDKLSQEKFNTLLETIGLTKEQIQKLNQLFMMSSDDIFNLVPDSQGVKELQELLILSDKVFKQNNPLRFDFTIVRGLAYYTGLVFEAYDKNPENPRALFGGGRYDNLLDLFNKNNSVSGVGFAIGDVTFEAFLRGHGLLTDEELKPEKHMVAIDSEIPLAMYHSIAENLKNVNNVYHDTIQMLENMTYSENQESLNDSYMKIFDVLTKNAFFDMGDRTQIVIDKLLKELLSKNPLHSVEIFPDQNLALGKQLQYANKAKIDYVWICGMPELQRGILKRKNMGTGKEEEFDLKTFEFYGE